MTDDFYAAVEFYKRGLFDFICYTDKVTGEPFKLHYKQVRVMELLNDNETTYVGYGGAARGGKSALIALDSILCAHAFPECHNLIARKNLTILWETTWVTFNRMLVNFGFEDKKDYTYHVPRHELTFANKSVILTKNLEFMPSDKEATEYGSLEILRAYIDQSEHVHIKIIEKIGERVGSHYTSAQYKSKGKVLEAFNPSPNHTKSRYWLPFQKNEEKTTRKFIQALPSDNPGKEAKEWVKQKEKDHADGTMSNNEYKKQIKGDFNFDDNPSALLSYENINNIWFNTQVNTNHQDKCIICDVARFGSDSAVITVWYGLQLYEYHKFDISSTVMIQTCINAMRGKHGIPASRTLADEDGVGGGVVDNCRIVGFKNGSTPPDKAYASLKEQCGYLLAEKIKEIYFAADVSNEMKERIEEELGQLMTYQSDKDNKLRLLPKEKIKENIGRSPDWLDVFIMRMYFYLYAPEEKNEILKRALKFV